MRCSGDTGASEQVDEVSGACHKRFKTEAQAEAFIDDWKEAYADVVRRAVKQQLDKGLRPLDMRLNIGLLHNRSADLVVEDIAEQMQTRLRLT